MQLAGQLNPLFRRLAAFLPPGNPVRSSLSRVWAAVLNTSASNALVAFHGQNIWVLPRWRSLNSKYEAEAVQSFLLSLQHGDTFWDVGSHIGLYSLLAARKIGKSGKIFAWEPSPQAFADLNTHLRLNGVDSICRTIQEVVNDGKQSEVTFAIDSGNETSATNQIYHAGFPKPGSTLTIPARSLDEWAQTLKWTPNVLKMDIEGAEVGALEGASRLARGEFGAPPRILLSVHPASIHQYGRTCSELAAWVEAHGYKAVTLGGETANLSEFGEVWLIPNSNKLK